MGYYIDVVKGQTLPPKSKVIWLMTIGEAKVAETPVKFQPNLVCVVENAYFDAAGYAFSKEEMEAFLYPDPRPKTWLIVPNAAELSGYKN
jgi:hypothetical protein